MLIEGMHNTLTQKDVEQLIESIPQLECAEVNFDNNHIEIMVIYRQWVKRRWVIDMPFSRIPFESLVYVTDTGYKYHLFGCDYLKRSLVPLIYSRAILSYGGCKVCTLK
jgi:hypothetical protein